MDIQNRNFLSIEQLTDRYINTGRPLEKKTDQEVSFQDIFRQKTLAGADTDLKFSKHAAGRLNDRGIALDEYGIGPGIPGSGSVVGSASDDRG